ncbi:polysaccharide biosynthesis tyrosine autokinase [Mycetocola lacteus]|uniref:non-specific protein-tyrosine kinase n=1 Tax=Mycetocola lacteus TaxID=76637 RepID=A0A3L7ALP7_9MICO|nr:polysaccharide biosynthesis tyrosine autokinase [Mycetocola lacteus]RLP80650.1 polysaccharide biosynthesis tyrosine autokinase [Mycetocola lacteus]RLP84435.1 polysaccharide biosynthesis tyrosine autokinase [Mycetocola lacteus]
MNFTDYIAAVRRHWIAVVIAIVIACGIAGVATAVATPQYQSKTQLFVSVGGGDSVGDLAQGNSFSERRVSSYVSLATSSRVLEPVIQKLNLKMSLDQLKASISAASPPTTVLINITVTHPDPELAKRIADAVAESLVSEVEVVEGSASTSLIKMSVAEEAVVPTVQSSPDIKKNLLMAIGVGGAIGVLYAVLRSLLDTRIRNREGVTNITDASILGVIAEEPGLDDDPLAILTDPYGVRAENFRQLRTQLQFTNLDHTSQSVVVTSSLPGEGKSSTSINLALMLAEGGGRVLLIDADLRRPRVATYLGLEGTVGLTTVLAGRVDVADAIQSVGNRSKLDVLTSGQIPPNPSELLGSATMNTLLRDLEEHYDTIILDAPPTLPVTDPAVLSTITSGVLMVATLDGRLHNEELRAGLDNLDGVGARILGVALNRMPQRASAYATYGYQDTIEPSRREMRKSARRAKKGSKPGSPQAKPPAGPIRKPATAGAPRHNEAIV